MSLYLPCDCKPRFIKNYDGPPRCSSCGALALEEKPARIYRQLDVDYDCPITGRPIRSKHAHEENLKIHGCHIFEKGEEADAARARKEADRKLEAIIDASVESQIAAMPESKKAALAAEVLTSEVTVTRN